jgi:hypothetical chaperone protein
MRSIGLDFGTTNSAFAEATATGPRLARYQHAGGWSDTFRSVLYFAEDVWKAGHEAPVGGQKGIDAYLAAGSGRLVQSLKSYLADRVFDRTNVFGRALSLPDLLGLLLRSLRREAELDMGPLGSRLVVGRPVRFANADTPEDEEFALARLRGALALAGFEDVQFALEPVAAAYYYERRLDHDELILVGDFGGGTSDFSVARVGPGHRHQGAGRILSSDGVALAGDAIDGRIVEHAVAPALGLGSTYRSMFDKSLDMPVWLYERLRRWHHLSFLKDKSTMRLIEEIKISSSDPEAIEALHELVDCDLGFALHRAVGQTKVALSSVTESSLRFELPSKTIDRPVLRTDLDSWIVRETTAISASIDRALAAAGVGQGDIDRVFLTGGTSFVPAVRALFTERFGQDRIASGGEMISVAAGLSQMALEGAA